MDNKKYYKCLGRVPNTNGNVNSQWAVVKNHIPFKNVSDAVKFALQVYGDDYKPGSETVIIDPETCKARATVLYPEVIRLRDMVHNMIETNDEELHRKAKERDDMNVNSLWEQVQKELLEEKIHEMIGYSSALHDVWQMLHARQYELWECSHYAGKG